MSRKYRCSVLDDEVNCMNAQTNRDMFALSSLHNCRKNSIIFISSHTAPRHRIIKDNQMRDMNEILVFDLSKNEK